MAAHAGRIETFLVHEARLLDERRFDEWLALFADDGWYWVPIEPGQKSPHDTVSLMYDDRLLLETRVRRLASPGIHAQHPPSRTSRMIANVTVESDGDGETVVRTKFQMVEYRRNAQRLFAGTYFHGLRPDGDGYRIGWKRVDLINCDAVLDGLSVPF